MKVDEFCRQLEVELRQVRLKIDILILLLVFLFQFHMQLKNCILLFSVVCALVDDSSEIRFNHLASQH